MFTRFHNSSTLISTLPLVGLANTAQAVHANFISRLGTSPGSVNATAVAAGPSAISAFGAARWVRALRAIAICKRVYRLAGLAPYQRKAVVFFRGGNS